MQLGWLQTDVKAMIEEALQHESASTIHCLSHLAKKLGLETSVIQSALRAEARLRVEKVDCRIGHNSALGGFFPKGGSFGCCLAAEWSILEKEVCLGLICQTRKDQRARRVNNQTVIDETSTEELKASAWVKRVLRVLGSNGVETSKRLRVPSHRGFHCIGPRSTAHYV